MASIQIKLKEIDTWIRNRLRYCIWHDCKKPERKRNLIRLGIHNGQAYACSRTRMKGWAVANGPILGKTITLKRLAQRGYESLLTHYEKVSPQLNEPLYTRPVRKGGVRGAPRQLQLARQPTQLENVPAFPTYFPSSTSVFVLNLSSMSLNLFFSCRSILK
jgi:hypothetical protein